MSYPFPYGPAAVYKQRQYTTQTHAPNHPIIVAPAYGKTTVGTVTAFLSKNGKRPVMVGQHT